MKYLELDKPSQSVYEKFEKSSIKKAGCTCKKDLTNSPFLVSICSCGSTFLNKAKRETKVQQLQKLDEALF